MKTTGHKQPTKGMAILPATMAALMLCGSPALASIVLRGHVAEPDGEPAIGVVAKTYATTDSLSTTTFSSSGLEGEFLHTLPATGTYVLELSGIGMRDSTLRFNVAEGDTVVDLPLIRLERDTEMLAEVVVSARKPIIQSDGGTLTYNVEEDPSASSTTTLEMLRKVPMVSVDADDNIKIKGQTDFKVFLNGREDPMLSRDPKTILKSLPASTIKKIEVITEPGAKYDAEGTGGILNIITTSNSHIEGYTANLTLFGGNQFIGASAYGMTKVGNVTGSANVSWFDSSVSGNSIRQTTDTEYTGDQDPARQTIAMHVPPLKNNHVNANLDLSWEPNAANLFTLSGYIGHYGGRFDSDIEALAISRAESPLFGYRQSMDQKYSGIWAGMTASMQHNFRRPGHNLTLSYQLTAGNSRQDRSNGFSDAWGDLQPAGADMLKDHSDNWQHTLQADYTLPLLLPGHLLEAGAKCEWSPETSDRLTADGPDQAHLETKDEVKLKRTDDVLAAYASYSAHLFAALNAKAGLRYEHTKLGQHYLLGSHPDFTTNLNDFVPNAALSWQLGPASSIRAAYQMRLTRPSAEQLSPFVDSSQPTQVSTGNPNLKSSRFNNVNLSISSYGMRLGGSASVGYSRNGNDIVQAVDARDGVIHMTYVNLGRSQTWSLDLNGTWTVIPSLRLSAFGSVRHKEFTANLENFGSNKGWEANYTASADYTTPFRMRITLAAGGASKSIEYQGKGSSFSYQSLSFSRSFLKEDRLTVSLSANNFLHPTRSWKKEVTGPGMTTTQTTRLNIWNVSANVSWRFGNLNSQVKKTQNRLEQVEQKKEGSTPGL